MFSSSEPETVIESALVVHYLIDAFPHLSGHIYPAAKDPKSAYHRYTLNLLLDTWMNKVNSSLIRAQVMAGTDEVPTAADDPFEAIKTHIEPQLAKVTGHGKGPFFGGAERLTLFEVSLSCTANQVFQMLFCDSRNRTHSSYHLFRTMLRSTDPCCSLRSSCTRVLERQDPCEVIR